VVKRNNGEFLTFKKKVKGRKTNEVLKVILPKVINSIHFKKSMKWGYGKTTFARPIRWIMCIYNTKKLVFELENIKSDSKSYGHRFLSPKPFSPKNWNNYMDHLIKRDVYLDQSKRKKFIEDEIQKLALELGGIVEKNEELVKTVTNLVEYPVVLHGTFEKSFLKIPKEVLISVMQNHQKYFPVFSKSGKLLPYFIFVCGTRVVNNETVVKGNERVLRARFRDAEFFWNEDIKKPLKDSRDKLKDMLFLSGVGSYYKKTERLKNIAENLASYSGICNKYSKNYNPDLVGCLIEAAHLSKADLVSKMVFELPELQGTMGKHYAKKSGVKTEVATAIEEHYMPRERNGNLPRTETGALLSIADKIDNISSCFVTGLKPTGSTDPHALRRQSIGIIQIVLKKKLNFNLETMFSVALKEITTITSTEEILPELMNFVSERFKNLALEIGYSNNVIDSVLSTGFDNILDSYNRIKAMERFKKQKSFDELTVVFKRIVNITKDKPKTELGRNLFKDKSENILYNDYIKALNQTKTIIKPAVDDYIKALNQIKTLRKPVDDYIKALNQIKTLRKPVDDYIKALNQIKTIKKPAYDHITIIKTLRKPVDDYIKTVNQIKTIKKPVDNTLNQIKTLRKTVVDDYIKALNQIKTLRKPVVDDYIKALNQIKTLRKPVDKFFNSVLVMHKDEELRNNRLALLNEIKDIPFRMGYDFSKF